MNEKLTRNTHHVGATSKTTCGAPYTMTIDKNQIGDYNFVKTLGRGTFGKVKLGVHIHTQ